MSYPGNGLRGGSRPGSGNLGLPPGRSPRTPEARSGDPLRPFSEGLGGSAHRRRWLCLSPVENPLPPLADAPEAFDAQAAALPSALRGPLVRIRPGQVIQAVAEVVAADGGAHLCGRVTIPLLDQASVGTDLADEDEAWYRADLLLHGIFTRQGHQAVLRFEPGPPLALTVSVLIPLAGGETPPRLEELLSSAFLG